MRALLIGLALTALTAGAAQAAENTLTAAEKKTGWTLLFDGKDTKGWQGFKGEPHPGWIVKGGVLSPEGKASKDLVSAGKYENFELDFDWAISPKGNSGVMYHVLDRGDETYWSGPEYQILDNAHGEKPPQQAGSLFAIYPPSQDVTKPVGEFNHARLIVDHGRVQHWLNGVKLLEYDLNSADFKAKVAASKFAAWGLFATGETGRIALQNHGDWVGFRNIKIKTLR
jgi:hypothetical protein